MKVIRVRSTLARSTQDANGSYSLELSADAVVEDGESDRMVQLALTKELESRLKELFWPLATQPQGQGQMAFGGAPTGSGAAPDNNPQPAAPAPGPGAQGQEQPKCPTHGLSRQGRWGLFCPKRLEDGSFCPWKP